MNRFALLVLALLLTVPLAVSAQSGPEATPTPAPINPHEYNDPAMHFVAPAGWFLVGYRLLQVDDLGDDPEVVAGWAGPDRSKPQAITITQQSFEGDVQGFEERFENGVRQQFDSVLIKNKESMSLKNGMPAYFVDVTYGSGFDSRKEYAVIWSDGARGVAITITARTGELDAATAKKLISDVSAVRYPLGR